MSNPVTAGSWPAVETVREALKARQRGTGSTRNTEPALDALARLEAALDAADAVIAMFNEHAPEWMQDEDWPALPALREALARVREPAA